MSQGLNIVGHCLEKTYAPTNSASDTPTNSVIVPLIHQPIVL